MAEIFSEDAESGTGGVTVAPSTSEFDTDVNGSIAITYSTLWSAEGSKSIDMIGTGWGNIQGLFTSSTATPFLSVYVQVAAVPSEGNVFLWVYEGSTTTFVAGVRMLPDGSLQLRDGTSDAGTATTKSFVINDVFRLDYATNNPSNGQQTLRIFYGSNLHGTTPDETRTGVLSNVNAIQRFGIGNRSAIVTPGMHLRLDRIKASNSQFVSPIAVTIGGAKVRTAADVWTAAVAKRWSGAAWVTCTPKVWDGTQWVTSGYNPGGDTTPPTSPGTPSASVSGVNVSLTWAASTDNVAVTGYRVYRSTNSGFVPPGAGSLVGTVTTNSFTNTAVPVGTYYYKIIAYDAAGNISTPSAQVSATVTSAGATRFYGDPGPGKMYLGTNPDLDTNGPFLNSINGFNNRLKQPLVASSTNFGNGNRGLDGCPAAPLTTYNSGVGNNSGRIMGIIRSFNSTSTESGTGPDGGDIANTITTGGLPFISWKWTSPANVSQLKEGGGKDTIIRSWANEIKSYEPWPIWWAFWHEPNESFQTRTLAQNYRLAQRHIKEIFDQEGVQNAAFFPALYQNYQWRSGRDNFCVWTLWPDLIGDPDEPWSAWDWNPQPSEVYGYGTSQSRVDGFSSDCYPRWYTADGLTGSAGYRDATKTFYNAVTNRLAVAYPTGIPQAIGEWTQTAYSASPNPAVRRDPPAEGTNATGDVNDFSHQNSLTHSYAGTGNAYAIETFNLVKNIKEYFISKNVVGVCWFNGAVAPVNQVSECRDWDERLLWFDPHNARIQGLASCMDDANIVTVNDVLGL